jgi:hypothetical protein
LNDQLHKQAARENETEEQHRTRLLNDQLHKQAARENETEEQHRARLLNDQLHNQTARENETEEQHHARLLNDQLHKQAARENETEEQHRTRLLNDQLHKQAARQNESEDQRRRRLVQQQKRTAEGRSNRSKQRKSAHIIYIERPFETVESVVGQSSKTKQASVINPSPRQLILQENQPMILDQYIWPAAIPTNLKKRCLEEFSNHMSMSFLRQSICVICNSRVDFSTMKEYSLQDIPNLEKLSCHTDVSDIISKTQQLVHGIDTEFIIIDIIFIFFWKMTIQIRVSFLCLTQFSTKEDITQAQKLVICVSNATVH